MLPVQNRFPGTTNLVATPAAAFTEILTQPLRVGVRIGQSDVAVWPDEIEGPALETGSLHSRLPREAVEPKQKFDAGFGHAGPRFAVHVDLPVQRGERSEVVLSWLRLDPRQPIPTPDGPGRARAQRAVAIVDADLRQGPEHKATPRRKSK